MLRIVLKRNANIFIAADDFKFEEGFFIFYEGSKRVAAFLVEDVANIVPLDSREVIQSTLG